jgi:GNAT superfamily N-acetyltransferase
MGYEIYPLSMDRINDFLNFFDNIAFSDNNEWDGCYCIFYHVQDEKIKGKDLRRKKAIELIEQYILCGYLAYLNNDVVGWCNVSDKKTYPYIVSDENLYTDDDANKKIKSIVCFVIAPSMRLKGVATKLLEKICSDAKSNNYEIIEGYPNKNADNCFSNYKGPIKLYNKFNFKIYKELKDNFIYRKYL